MLLFLVTALGAHAIFIQCNSAQRATVNVILGVEFRRCRIDTTYKGNLGNVQLVFQQVIDNLNHTLDSHGFLRHYQPAIRISLS